MIENVRHVKDCSIRTAIAARGSLTEPMTRTKTHRKDRMKISTHLKLPALALLALCAGCGGSGTADIRIGTCDPEKVSDVYSPASKVWSLWERPMPRPRNAEWSSGLSQGYAGLGQAQHAHRSGKG